MRFNVGMLAWTLFIGATLGAGELCAAGDVRSDSDAGSKPLFKAPAGESGQGPVPSASASINCGNGKTLKLSTGSDTGNCRTNNNNGGTITCDVLNDNHPPVSASCKHGCPPGTPGVCSLATQ